MIESHLWKSLNISAVKLWTEYCQYVLDNMEGEDGVKDARAVFERAITSVGLHLTEVSSYYVQEYLERLCDPMMVKLLILGIY